MIRFVHNRFSFLYFHCCLAWQQAYGRTTTISLFFYFILRPVISLLTVSIVCSSTIFLDIYCFCTPFCQLHNMVIIITPLFFVYFFSVFRRSPGWRRVYNNTNNKYIIYIIKKKLFVCIKNIDLWSLLCFLENKWLVEAYSLNIDIVNTIDFSDIEIFNDSFAHKLYKNGLNLILFCSTSKYFKT